MNRQIRHNPLPQIIQRRIRHLRKVLIKKVKKGAWLRRQNRKTRRIPHRPNRLLTRRRHWKNHLLQILIRHPEKRTTIVQSLWNRTHINRYRKHAIIERRVIMFLRRTRIPKKHLSTRQIHRHTTPGKQRAFRLNLRRIRPKRPRLRRQIKLIFGSHPPARPKPIAIQPCPNRIPICVGNQCRPVPRLHRTPPKLIIPVSPCGRRHTDRQNILHIRNAAPIPQRFHHFVKTTRIANTLPRKNFVFLHPDHLLPRFRPRTIPRNRVNLPVMANQSEGLRLVPRRGRIGAKPPVKQAKPRFVPWVPKVRIKRLQRLRLRKRLIHDGFGRKGRKKQRILQPLLCQSGTRELLGRIEPLIERKHCSRPLRPSNKRMQNTRQTLPRSLPKYLCLHRHIPVLQQIQAKYRKRRLQGVQHRSLHPRVPLHKQRRHGNRILLIAKQIKRNIGHHPGTIPRQSIRSTGPPMLHTTQCMQPLLQIGMTVQTLPASHKPYTTSRMFLPRVFKIILRFHKSHIIIFRFDGIQIAEK